jgi:hypothetical protein
LQGIDAEPVEEYADARMVLAVFVTAEAQTPGLAAAMREVYHALGAFDALK